MRRYTAISVVLAFQMQSDCHAQEYTDPDRIDAPRLQLLREDPCEENTADADIIIVCAERDRTEDYRSPIPRPVDPKIRILPGFEPPPCVNNLLSFCGRFGGPSTPAEMVDLTRIPDALSAQDAARISAEQAIPEDASPGAPR